MKTTGDFVLHYMPIEFGKYGEEITIVPFGDCHYGAPLFADDKWQEFVAKYRNKKNCYFIGMGDYMDVISTSERNALKSACLHDSTEDSLDGFVRKQTLEFAKSIMFMKGKLIGLLSGNHYYKYVTGVTTDQHLCELLGAKYLGCKTLVYLSMRTNKGSTHPISIVLSAYHGESGGRMPGSSINKLYHMSSGFDADIHLMGHDHNKMVDFTNKIGVSMGHGSLRMYNKKVLLARTGSFLRGYVDGKKSYVCDANMAPNDLGVIEIKITPYRDKTGGDDTTGYDITATI